MYYYELPPQQGWICPICGRVNAPWMPTCGCVSSQTSGTPYLVKTSSTSQDSHEIAKTEPQIKQSEEFKQFIGHDCSKCRWSKYGEACTIPCCDFEPKDEPQTEVTTDCRQTDCPWR